MDRTEFLDLCKKVTVFSRGVGNVKSTPPSVWLKFNDMTFYPVGYKLTFTKDGKPLHTAILHDLKANSIIECDLIKVERICSDDNAKTKDT